MGPSFGGFVYFAGAKFLGYSAFVHFLRKKWNDVSTEKPWRTFEIGGTRTLIGVGVGISYGLLFAGIVEPGSNSERCMEPGAFLCLSDSGASRRVVLAAEDCIRAKSPRGPADTVEPRLGHFGFLRS